MMPPVLHYPDLASPPAGWTVTRIGSQIRLVPPKNAAAPTNATIIVSPLVARHKGLHWLEGGYLEATYNHAFQNNRYGNARIGNLALSLAF